MKKALIVLVALAALVGCQKNETPHETKTLTFDFTGTVQTGWPTKDKWMIVETAPVPDSTVIYKLDEVNYPFVICSCRDAKQARIAWTSSGLTIYAAQRFLGLPALSGWKLIGVKCTQSTTPASSRKAGITDKVTATSSESYSYVTGGESVVWDVNTITYSLAGTQANTVYYLACTAGGVGYAKIELTYEKE